METKSTADELDRANIARAIRRIRLGKGMTQRDAAENLDISTQAWQRYEAGQRNFTRHLLGKLAESLQTSVDVIIDESSRPTGPVPTPDEERVVVRPANNLVVPVWGRVRAGSRGPQVYDSGAPDGSVDLASLFGADMGAIRIAGESMVPWGEPGELVVFDRNRYPRRGQGCVIETIGGEFHVKLYEKSNGSSVFVKDIYPEEYTAQFQLSDLRGVYAVRMRGD